jgi:glycosyltransferase involved in cell wall biosynthesis
MKPYQSGDPLVSFFVTAYNTEKFISDCLDSILNQTGGYDFEIVIVDDASTDNTEQVARSYTDPRIHYHRHATNQGAFVTVNDGFELSRGQFIARIDSDDRYRPDFLATALPILQQYPEVGLVYGDIAIMNTDGTITSKGHNVERDHRSMQGNELFPLLKKNYIPAPTILARREAWTSTLPVPHGFNFCDWFLSVGIAKTWDFFYVDQVVADYRIHTQNMHRKMIRDKMGEQITFQVLDQVFSEPDRQLEKRQHKADVYASNYLTLADKYFGSDMYEDARRCYLAAIRFQPKTLLISSVLRHLAATFLGLGVYERSKSLIKSVRKIGAPI